MLTKQVWERISGEKRKNNQAKVYAGRTKKTEKGLEKVPIVYRRRNNRQK